LLFASTFDIYRYASVCHQANKYSGGIKTVKLTMKEKVNVLLSRRGKTRKDLAGALGINERSVANKMGGDTDWTLPEVETMAVFFEMPITELVE
jgi:DNA-binding XRE family transcriptional regulator